MFENEITIVPDLSLDELQKLLEQKGFRIKQEYDIHDSYMIKPWDISFSSTLDTIKKAIILRKIITEKRTKRYIEFKIKEYNNQKEIISQSKINCEIASVEDMKNVLTMMYYQPLITLDDHLIIYENNEDEICIQVVNNDAIYIEIENSPKYQTIADMKNVIKKYNIPVKNGNYFANKLEDALNKQKQDKQLSNNADYINKIVDIKIDRPLGTTHPKHGFYYPINYGYVPNTVSGDGEELDCYLIGVSEPVDSYRGKCIAVIHRTNDDDDKLVICPEDKEYSNDAIEALTEFQEKYFKHIIIR